MNLSSFEVWEILQLLLSIAGLIGVNALLVAADFALIKLHFSRFELPAAERGEFPADILENPRLVEQLPTLFGSLRRGENQRRASGRSHAASR